MADNTVAFPEAAYSTLVTRIHAPIFFQKLASDYGIHPQTDQERVELLELAGLIQNAKAAEQTKSAAAKKSLITEAADSLKSAMAGAGFTNLAAPTSQERLVKEAAQYAASDASVAEAAVAFAQFLAANTR